MLDPVYFNNINNTYLSLATGSEDNKGKFPNPNLEHIFKTEDKMFELDTQIDNIEKSLAIIVEQCNQFDALPEAEQAKYKFPAHLLNPLRFYWDTKYRKAITEQYFKEGKLLKAKEMASLKKAFTDKLEFLRGHKSGPQGSIKELKDQLRKNFTKSLDHKSCVYKHFIKKLMSHTHHIGIIKRISEDNNRKRRIGDDKYLLYGSGEQPKKFKQQKFYNTFGEEFGGNTHQQQEHVVADYPIDMQMMEEVDDDLLGEVQNKCPHSRLLMNNKQALSITLKLIMQYIKLTNINSAITIDKKSLIKALRFIMTELLCVDNFDEILEKSKTI